MSQIAGDQIQVQRFIDVGDVLPASPKRGHIFFLVGAVNKIYACFVDAAWVEIAAATSTGLPIGGTDTQVQFNDAAAFGGDAGLTYNKTKDALTMGYPIVTKVAAPADGDLAASQVSLWFTDTDGAAKLAIKGKSANGTVVTALVALS